MDEKEDPDANAAPGADDQVSGASDDGVEDGGADGNGEVVGGGEAAADAAADAAAPATEVAAALDLGLPGITLLTPPAGEGPRPVLRWEPVPDADSYLVILRADVEAAASWVWRGTDTQIRVGFVTDPGLGGPEVQPGMVWSVLALDGEQVPVAQSAERSITP